MKKNVIFFSMIMAVVLSSCGKVEDTTIPLETTTAATTLTAAVEKTEEVTDISDLDALAEVTVEKELFDVVLTVPKDFIGEQTTQEDLDIVCNDNGFQSITLNEDGSATYVMTKSQHKKLMEEYRSQINSSLREMIGSTDYPNITDIKANDNFTEYTVTTTSTELDLAERISTFGFYANAALFGIFNGTTPDNVCVTFVNADTGNVIETFNSSDMAE